MLVDHLLHRAKILYEKRVPEEDCESCCKAIIDDHNAVGRPADFMVSWLHHVEFRAAHDLPIAYGAHGRRSETQDCGMPGSAGKVNAKSMMKTMLEGTAGKSPPNREAEPHLKRVTAR